MSLQTPSENHSTNRSRAYLTDEFRQDVVDAWAILWSGGRLQQPTARRLLAELRGLTHPQPPYRSTEQRPSQPTIDGGIRTLPWIHRAKQTCDRDQKWASKEHTAFKQFRARVAQLSATPPTKLKQILQAYAETLGSLDHFDSSPETFKQNMSDDLSPDLVAHILRGGALSPPIKQSVLDHVSRTLKQRKAIMNGINRERGYIDSLAETLAQVDRQRASTCELLLDIDDIRAPELLTDCHNRLDEYLSTVTDLANTRRNQILSQSAVHSVPRTETSVKFPSIPINGCKKYPWFYALLYNNLQPIDPVLSAIAHVSIRIKRVQTAINSLGSCEKDILTASATRYQSP